MGKSLITFLPFFFFIASITSFAQDSDIAPDSKLNVNSMYGITSDEMIYVQNKPKVEYPEIPAEIIDALKEARQSGNIQEVERLNDLIYSEYRTDVKKIVGTVTEGIEQPIPQSDLGYFGDETDWLGTDVTVYSGATANYQSRTLDLKRGDDGALYVAHIVSQATDRRIRVHKSTDGGTTWSVVGGIFNPSNTLYYQTVSMLVERRGSIDDSIRVIVYYTRSADTNNDDASLGFFSFRPNTAGSPDYIIKTLDTPTPGREFNYVSAVSDGQYWSTGTFIGCVVAEYSNDADTTVAMRLYQSSTWGDTHNSISMDFAAGGWRDRFPNAQLLAGPSFSQDSIMFVTQRNFSTYTANRVFVTPWGTLGTAYRSIFLTASGNNYEKPVITIKQSPAGTPKSIIIATIKDSVAKYHRSLNGGISWDLDFTLDGSNSKTTRWVYASSDSLDASGSFMVIYTNFGYDSVNVRRGNNGSLGGTTYMQNSSDLTGTNPPVCLIQRDGSNLYSTFAYWAFGPADVLFDSEQLPISSVQNNGGIVESYELVQNYPNPFNPATVIKFNLPEQDVVTLKIYDNLGREVATLVNEQLNSGSYEVNFNAQNLASGVYFYRIQTSKFTDTKKMMLLK